MDVAKAKKLADCNEWKEKITCGFLALRGISDQIKVAIWQEEPNLGWQITESLKLPILRDSKGSCDGKMDNLLQKWVFKLGDAMETLVSCLQA